MLDAFVLAAVSVAAFAAMAFFVYRALHARMPASFGYGLLATFLAIVGLLFVPEVFLIPSNAGAYWFEHHLSTGMTRSQVERLRIQTSGATGGTMSSSLGNASCNHPSVCVWYTTTAQFCIEGGRLYRLSFDRDERLRSWETGAWADGC